MKIPVKKGAQAFAAGGRYNRDRCRNCEILEARIFDAKQTLREVKRELRRKVRELRNKREKMNLILLTFIDICYLGSHKLNRGDNEENIRNPAFIRENIQLANSIVKMVNRYRDEMAELDIHIEDEE